jgi:hypothetical protein
MSIYVKIIVKFYIKIMAKRNRKAVLNQNVKEQPEIKKEEVVECEPISINLKAEMPEVDEEIESPVYEDDGEEDGEIEVPSIKITFLEEDVKDLDEKFGVDLKKEIEEIIQEEITVRKKTIAELSVAELRHYRRTGKLPE